MSGSLRYSGLDIPDIFLLLLHSEAWGRGPRMRVRGYPEEAVPTMLSKIGCSWSKEGGEDGVWKRRMERMKRRLT